MLAKLKIQKSICRLYIAAPILSDDESSDELISPTWIIKSSNVEKVAPGSNNIKKITTESSNNKEVTAKSSNWRNQNFEDKDLIMEEEQQWENTINERIELGEQKNQSENQDDEILLASDWNMNF
ncbi:571_t:CDS:2, partial [Dentiscutata erythropus]